MLNVIFNIHTEAGLLTKRACELFDILKHKYNNNDKMMKVQMIKRLHDIRPKKGEDPKVMHNKFEALKVKHQILENDTVLMNFWYMHSCTN